MATVPEQDAEGPRRGECSCGCGRKLRSYNTGLAEDCLVNACWRFWQNSRHLEGRRVDLSESGKKPRSLWD